MKQVKNISFRKCPFCDNQKGRFIINLNNTNLLRCENCSMVFADIPKQNVLEKNIYDLDTFYRYLQKEHLITAAYYDQILNKIIRHFKTPKLKLLEFGCGSGQFLLRAKRKGIEAYGSDFSPYSELAGKEFNLNIETKNIFETEYSENSFDVVFSHATYEHIYEVNAVTEKLKQLLKPNGLMIISGVPDFNLLSRRWFNNYHVNKPPGHVNYFEKKTIRKLFDNHNLTTLNISSYGIDIWFIKSKILSIFRKKNTPKNIQENQISKGKKNIGKFKNATQNIKFLHKVLALLYRSIGFIIPGKSIEAWAIKK